jgi:tetratricopeptide (TPR) repeat protein
MKGHFIIFMLAILVFSCHRVVSDNDEISQEGREAVIDKYLKNGAWKYHYLTKEWAEWIDKGIKEDSTIAILWQQKALPYWKQKKYQLATTYYDKAVRYDRALWLSRLGFLKCIFSKDYPDALKDLTAYISEFGSTYQQDHPLEMYLGICYLQLGEIDKAYEVLKTEVETQAVEFGENWVPFLDRFYLGVTLYELKDYESAIDQFDKALMAYPNFSDAQYYKSLCMHYLGRKEEAKNLMANAKSNFKSGYTFNEDSSKYEDYPYQVTWQWAVAESLVN